MRDRFGPQTSPHEKPSDFAKPPRLDLSELCWIAVSLGIITDPWREVSFCWWWSSQGVASIQNTKDKGN